MIEYYDIKGAIKNPGVYKLENKITINDAIKFAGGLTKKSDTSRINLSKQVKDEMVIYIFKKSDYIIKTCNCKTKYESICPENVASTSAIPTTKTSTIISTTLRTTIIPTTTKLIESSLININTSTIEELITIKGLGLVKAQNIIKYREEIGLFQSIEDIKNVSGIGETLFEKIKDFITI